LEKKILKNYRYNNISLTHRIGNRLEIFHGIGNISINNAQQYSSLIDGNKEFDVKTSQWDYYLLTDIYAGSGISMNAFLHFLNVNIEDVIFSIDSLSGTPLAVYKKSNTETNEILGGISINYAHSFFLFNYSLSLSNFNSANQIQNNVKVALYPLGNLDLYLINDFVLHNNKIKTESSYRSRFLWSVKLGFNISDFLWLEGHYTAGEIMNYREDNGYIVYNNLNLITDKFGFNAIIPVSPKMELSLRYQSYYQESFNTVYYDALNYKYISINNINHSIIGGIKWTF